MFPRRDKQGKPNQIGWGWFLSLFIGLGFKYRLLISVHWEKSENTSGGDEYRYVDRPNSGDYWEFDGEGKENRRRRKSLLAILTNTNDGAALYWSIPSTKKPVVRSKAKDVEASVEYWNWPWMISASPMAVEVGIDGNVERRWEPTTDCVVNQAACLVEK